MKTSFSTVSVIYFLMQQTIFCCEMYFYLLVEGCKKKKKKMVLYISRAKIASIPTKISEKYFHPRKLHPWILTRNNTKTFSLENHLFFFPHKERERGIAIIFLPDLPCSFSAIEFQFWGPNCSTSCRSFSSSAGRQ